ncbi:protein OSCP1-like [Argiope bruennichi]|uniref:protein OSCP1-like n=1 Tax=Argiope bruennichi TaxID=94029 RepID=UPI002493F9DC|nr:protein OSCP1-like [Argiope bruennichi]
MADRALPIIFINLSGEMIYVIQQRLEAQNISEDKSRKVIQDIISTMLNDQFIKELFEPQHMYSRSAMQSVFEKLVHSSIMRLNSNSMSKLYDLMLMVFKYQVVNCEIPEEILLVTLNHMDAIKNCAKPYPELKEKVENVYSLLISNYKDMSHEDYQCLYKCIEVFLKDLNIRVSVLMRLGLQLPSGEITPCRNKQMPNVDYAKNNLKNNANSPVSQIKDPIQELLSYRRLEIDGDRGIELGKNIYVQPNSLQSKDSVSSAKITADHSLENENCQALEEITLLGRLIGKCNQSDFVPEIKLSANDDKEEQYYGNDIKDNCSVVNINASQVGQDELGRISNEFLLTEEKRERNDILELLDIAESNTI